MMITKNICDDETPTALKFETSQLELSIKTRNYLIIFSVPSNQFMPSSLRQFTFEWGDNENNYH